MKRLAAVLLCLILACRAVPAVDLPAGAEGYLEEDWDLSSTAENGEENIEELSMEEAEPGEAGSGLVETEPVFEEDFEEIFDGSVQEAFTSMPEENPEESFTDGAVETDGTKILLSSLNIGELSIGENTFHGKKDVKRFAPAQNGIYSFRFNKEYKLALYVKQDDCLSLYQYLNKRSAAYGNEEKFELIELKQGEEYYCALEVLQDVSRESFDAGVSVDRMQINEITLGKECRVTRKKQNVYKVHIPEKGVYSLDIRPDSNYDSSWTSLYSSYEDFMNDRYSSSTSLGYYFSAEAGLDYFIVKDYSDGAAADLEETVLIKEAFAYGGEQVLQENEYTEVDFRKNVDAKGNITYCSEKWYKFIPEEDGYYTLKQGRVLNNKDMYQIFEVGIWTSRYGNFIRMNAGMEYIFALTGESQGIDYENGRFSFGIRRVRMIKDISLHDFSYIHDSSLAYGNSISMDATFVYMDGTSVDFALRNLTSKAWQDNEGISYYIDLKDSQGKDVSWMKGSGWADLPSGTYLGSIRSVYMETFMQRELELNEVSSNVLSFRYEAPEPEIKTISLDKASVVLYAGASSAYRKTTLTVSGTGEKVSFKSSDKKVASVSSKGVVTAKKAGTAVITAYFASQSPDVSASCEVTVRDPVLEVSKKSITVKKGRKVSIAAKATPEAKISYQSADKKTAAVSAKGVVKGKKKGSTTITVSANGISRKVKVKVTK